MILHWEWLPLIAFILFGILYELSARAGIQLMIVFGALTVFSGIISFILYMLMGITWIIRNIHIV